MANAAIDVSDGLLADLGHILEESRLSADLCMPDLPPRGIERDCLLAGGDDYELVFTTPAQQRTEVEALSSRLGLVLTRIGTVTSGVSPRLTFSRPDDVELDRLGYDHFR
jgi:thiamine-monophosphate kinase